MLSYNFSVMGFFLCVYIKIFCIFQYFCQETCISLIRRKKVFFFFQHEKFSEKFQVESHLWSHVQQLGWLAFCQSLIENCLMVYKDSKANGSHFAAWALGRKQSKELPDAPEDSGYLFRKEKHLQVGEKHRQDCGKGQRQVCLQSILMLHPLNPSFKTSAIFLLPIEEIQVMFQLFFFFKGIHKEQVFP